MRYMSIASFILLNYVFITTASRDYFKLELVQVLFRHGDRITDKEEVYKTDPYDPDFYDVYGYGQLTKIGMQRAYEVGQVLRDRYDNFVGGYKSDYVYAYSTDTDRTKMSLQLVLAGLYPPTDNTRWNESIHWSPIPIHYNPLHRDFLKIDVNGHCSRLHKILEDAEKTPEMQRRLEKYQDFLEHVRSKTGITTVRPFTVALVAGNIRAALSMGLPLPSWCSKKDYQKLQEIFAMAFDTAMYNETTIKTTVGPTLRQFLENIHHSERSKSKRRIYLYSAHDTNIAVFNRAHNFTNVPPVPDYGSALMFEKLRGRDNRIYIRMFLWTGVSKELIPLKLQDCDNECPLLRYVYIMQSCLPDVHFRKCTAPRIFNRSIRTRTKKIKSSNTVSHLFAGSDLHSFKYAEEIGAL